MGPVDVYEPLAVAADLRATCASALRYDALVSGGGPQSNMSYAWQFGLTTGSSQVESARKSGLLDVPTSGVEWHAGVTVSERHGTLSCQASAEGSASPMAPFVVELLPTAYARTCGGAGENTVELQALVTGGPATRIFQWSGAECEGPSCHIDSATEEPCVSRAISVHVKDPSGLCAEAVSPEVHYDKVTEVRIRR